MKLIIGNKNYSSWSLRAWFLMRQCELEFDEQRIALDVDTTATEIAKHSPAGRVPTLILDDCTVWDSLAIAETLAERYPDKDLWPRSDKRRAHARAVSAEMHSGFAAMRSELPMNCRATGRRIAINAEVRRDIDRIIDIWRDCQQQYRNDGDWLFGSFSVADAMFAPVVLRFRTYGVEIPESANAYANCLLENDAIGEWLLAAESETEVISHEEIGL